MADTNFANAQIPYNLGVIGGGNMAKAICDGIANKGLIKYAQVHVSAQHKETLEPWKEKGANVYTNNKDVVKNANVIIIAVKPHILKNVVADLAPFKSELGSDKVFISVLAGIELATLISMLNDCTSNSTVIRVMPNTPLSIGEGVSVYSTPANCPQDTKREVEKIFVPLGICKEVPESMINAIGALSGSGPAFVYLLIEAMSDGGVKMGIPREMATKFAAKTMLGAAKMVLETGKHPGQLKDEVCSPGGTTITGIHALEKGGVRGAIMDAIECAAKKSAELAKK